MPSACRTDRCWRRWGTRSGYHRWAGRPAEPGAWWWAGWWWRGGWWGGGWWWRAARWWPGSWCPGAWWGGGVGVRGGGGRGGGRRGGGGGGGGGGGVGGGGGGGTVVGDRTGHLDGRHHRVLDHLAEGEVQRAVFYRDVERLDQGSAGADL